eukprot:2644220-Prymnesium_polylepis.1
MAQITGGAALVDSTGHRRNCGLSVLETGPFLRGVQVDSTAFAVPKAMDFYPAHLEAVSYTHLTLPTICSV